MLSQKEGAEKAWNQERQVGPILTSSLGQRGMARSRVPWEEGEVTDRVHLQTAKVYLQYRKNATL